MVSFKYSVMFGSFSMNLMGSSSIWIILFSLTCGRGRLEIRK